MLHTRLCYNCGNTHCTFVHMNGKRIPICDSCGSTQVHAPEDTGPGPEPPHIGTLLTPSPSP